MAALDILMNIKTGLRISHTALDEDIQADIDACLEDLKVCGIAAPDVKNPLIYNAVKLYCRSMYTDDTAQAAEWLRRYEALKASLMMAEGFGQGVESDDE